MFENNNNLFRNTIIKLVTTPKIILTPQIILHNILVILVIVMMANNTAPNTVYIIADWLVFGRKVTICIN